MGDFLQNAKQIQDLANKVANSLEDYFINDVIYEITNQYGVSISGFNRIDIQRTFDKSEVYYDITNYGSEFWDERFSKSKISKGIDIVFEICSLLEDNMYGDYLLLNDNRTLWDIEVFGEVDDEYFYEDFTELSEQYVNEFESMYNTKIHAEGRNGRHICVDLTGENLCRYYDMCITQRKLEKELIDTMNNYY